MMMNPLPDINYAFSLVIQQEREMHSSINGDTPTASTVEETVALQVQTTEGNYDAKQGNTNYKGKNQGYHGSKGTNRICTHCGRTNHTLETSFQKHGYPPGLTPTPAAATANSATEASPQCSTPSAFGFTQEQYNNILALLQQSKLNFTVNSVSTSPFVMNSHASNMNVPIPVSLPNGSQVVASISGTIAISPSLTLHNVLYIPSFHVNLISVAKLIDSNKCLVQFTANNCHIMQTHSKVLIVPFKHNSAHSDNSLADPSPSQNLDDLPFPIPQTQSSTDLSLSSYVSTSTNDYANSHPDFNHHSPGSLTSLPNNLPTHTDSPEPSTHSEHTLEPNTLLSNDSSSTGLIPQSSADNNFVPLRQSSRSSHPPQYLKDYHCYSSLSKPHSHVLYPLSFVLTYNNCSPTYKHFYFSISSNTEPKTYNQAIKSDC
ncbi:hypothetical protein KIW84_043614 [Lathyrus oleraceus]|uniref:Retrovirus-related Pol polyprotein from transposon TNT 1-94-like beta-barrel domain-containing protein n=1 Tax=Pisum sativum TaxID=3888 RepID=A0A9D5AUX3_PEA|nr:hypothetical protein KIW84_043614 [Pisum sativum]